MSKGNKGKQPEVKVEVNEPVTNKYDPKEIEKYQKNGFLSKIPYWVKAILMKYWFFGAIIFFMMMGIPGLASSLKYVVAGIAGGAIIDVACNNILLLIETNKHEARHFMICPKSKHGVLSLFINVVYGLALFTATAYTCDAIIKLYKDGTFWLFQEPLTIALILSIYDGVVLGIKFGIVSLVKYLKAKKNNKI